MNCEKLFETIDSLYDSYLDVWEEACNIESPSRYKAGVDAVGDYFAAFAKQKGWKVEFSMQEVSGNVVAITMNPDADKAPLVLSGHMDTVQPVGLFGTPAVRRDDQYIYGPGVTDCKGGIIAALLAMDALERCGFKSRPIKLLLQSDEEVSSRPSNGATMRYICEQSKDAIGFLNLERNYPGLAVLVRKGTITFTFEVTGKEAHASLCAKAGASAILDAAHKIIEIEKLKDHDGLTCNVGVIEGGTVANTVPGKCTFKANVRYVDADQLAEVREYMQSVADTVHVAGCTCKLTYPKGRVAMPYRERNAALLARMNEIFEENGLPRLEVMKSNGASDAADISDYGIPCVDSLGVDGGRLHSAEEYALLESLKDAAKRAAAVAFCI